MKKDVMVLLALVLSYCTWGALFGPIMFNVVVRNTSKKAIDQVTLKFERFHFRFGVVVLEGNKTYGMQIGPWPSTLTATWIVEDQPDKEFTQELAVPKRLHAGRKEDLELVVEFKDDGPHVYPRVLEDLAHGLKYRYKD